MYEIAVSSTPDQWKSRNHRGNNGNGSPVHTSSKNQSNPREKLGLVVGAPNFIPDDLSTIAHETLGENSEHRTPEKKTYAVTYGNDDETQPETPPKFIVSTSSSSMYERSHGRRPSRFGRLFVCASCLGIVILGAIGILSYTFYNMNQDTSSTDSQTAANDAYGSDNQEFGSEMEEGWPGTLPTSPDLDTDDAMNFKKVEAIVLEQAGLFYDGVGSLSVEPASVPYQVLDWLSKDPSVMTYPGPTVLQRYAMGVVYWSLVGGDDSATATRDSTPWMTYTDACEWPTSHETTSLCDENNVVQSLYLEDWNFTGSLVSEIGLLTGLKMISLTSNKIVGELPTSIGLLTALERLNLPRNQFQGPLPTELGLLKSLVLLGLGNNQFSGVIPSEIGSLDQLKSLLLHHNSLSGLLPNELGDLSSLTALQLDSNRLQGQIPAELGRLTSLQELSLEDNGFGGELPSQVCGLESLLTVTVDCEFVTCSCCQNCVDTPTTMSPSDMDTQGSPAPTACEEVELVRDCWERGQVIEFTVINCEPNEKDVLALFRLGDVEGDTLDNPFLWESSCNDTFCLGAIDEDSLSFDGSTMQELNDLTWPLPDDEYVLMLLRFLRTGFYRVTADSKPFIVSDVCS